VVDLLADWVVCAGWEGSDVVAVAAEVLRSRGRREDVGVGAGAVGVGWSRSR
jgi:hypothetical protein